jgi:hypothetical protein
MQLRTKSVMPKVAIDMQENAALPGPSLADSVEFRRHSIEKSMSANAALSVGLEAIGQEVTQYARRAFENAGATTRGLLAAGTLEDVVRLQTDFAEHSVAGFVECCAKLAELGSALVGASVGAWVAHARK